MIHADVHASMTFNGQSYFAWHAAIPLERKLFISFDIRTNQTRARLLHLAGHMDYSFLEVMMIMITGVVMMIF